MRNSRGWSHLHSRKTTEASGPGSLDYDCADQDYRAAMTKQLSPGRDRMLLLHSCFTQ